MLVEGGVDIFQRLTIRFGHYEQADETCQQDTGAEEEVDAGAGAGEENGRGKCDDPVYDLVGVISTDH